MNGTPTQLPITWLHESLNVPAGSPECARLLQAGRPENTKM
jgi:hypothetical protein